MGKMISTLAKAAGSAIISGYAANQLLLLSPVSRPTRILGNGIASFVGLAYFVKFWIQDYYFDWSYNDSRDLTGRTAVVTGGTVDGLGYAAAELMYEQGAKVIITVRTKEKGETAIGKLKAQIPSPPDDNRASFVICDFLSESSVRNCAAEIITKSGGGIDFLILNAGISGQKESKTSTNGTNGAGTEDKVKSTHSAKVWMTNHVGPWIFAKELMPSLIQAAKRNPSEHPRAVWVSSGAHKRAFIDWEDPFYPRLGGLWSYNQSKLANIMHAREYQKRVRELLRKEKKETKANENLDVKCFSLTPGLVWTNILPRIPLLYPLFWLICRTPRMGAQVIKMACLDNDLEGGEYMSNCYVKESEGVDGCSNDEELWKRLWELTVKQVEEKEYEKLLEIPNASKKTD
jgi:NAD(P)-dependent dehydrogenase (short-subunit alcohol dehydrogenase family)